VRGRVAPEIEKPAPVNVIELTVTDAVPVELRVKDCDVEEFTDELPKLRLDVLRLNVGTAAFNCRVKAGSTVPAVAVNVTVCAVETAEMLAEKLALPAPAAMVTEAGTVTEEELLARFTVNPPLAAAAFRATVQASVPAPVMDGLAQETVVRTGTPAPLRAMVAVPLFEELLLMVRAPVAAPAAAGSNCTVMVAD
jgi:hypothetical protein